MDDRERQIYKMVQRNQRWEKIKHLIRKSKLIWILDPYPFETHNSPRTVVENYKREKIRQTYSWHNISRFQNERSYKAGLAGIVTAPILASFAIDSPPIVNFDFPVQMAFIFLSGMLFVLASVIYNKRTPYFVKAFLEGEENRKYKAAPIKEIRSSILFEFLKLGRTIKITPKNLHELENHQMDYKAAGLLLVRGGTCYKVGFDERGQATIERFIYTIARKQTFNIFEEYTRDDGEIGLRKRAGPITTYPTGDIYIRHLSIERVSSHFVTKLTPERVDAQYTEKDIVLKFYDPYIKTPDQIDKNSLTEPYARGLDVLLMDEYLDTIVEEISYWQSWQRPVSRLLAIWLYRLSLLSFSVFLLYQASVVWNALTIS